MADDNAADGPNEAQIEATSNAFEVGAFLEPGTWVRHPDRPDWGDGQVQSVVGPRVTVNFENAGKILVNAAVVALKPLDT